MNTKILFVCHGNICRSPMAEMVMKDMLEKNGLQYKFYVNSAATSREEIGHGIHHGTIAILTKYNIPFDSHKAIQMTKKDYDTYDYIIAMDDWNLRNILKIIGSDTEDKVFKLLSFAGDESDIADPWYTGEFETTYADIKRGCEGLLKTLTK